MSRIWVLKSGETPQDGMCRLTVNETRIQRKCTGLPKNAPDRAVRGVLENAWIWSKISRGIEDVHLGFAAVSHRVGHHRGELAVLTIGGHFGGNRRDHATGLKEAQRLGGTG